MIRAEYDHRGRLLVRGLAYLRDRVAYEDAANPRREGTIIEVRGGEYVVRWDEPNEGEQETVSDCRQQGWTFARGLRPHGYQPESDNPGRRTPSERNDR